MRCWKRRLPFARKGGERLHGGAREEALMEVQNVRSLHALHLTERIEALHGKDNR